jgi:hypothetical protein
MMEMVQTFRLVVVSVSLPIVELLQLVACRHLVSILLDVSKPVMDPVLNDVVPQADSHLGLGVLLPVLTAFMLWSFSTVSTSTVSKRLMDGADFGDFVFELVGDLDLEGPSVGGESGVGVQLRLGSLLNLGLCVSLHVSVVLDNVGPRGLGFNLGNFVLDSSFTFHFRVHN